MAANLTPREEAIMEVIKQTIRHRGYPPSVREIGQAVGLSSSSTVHGYLKKLEKKGQLRRDPTKPRAMEVLDNITTVKTEFDFLEVPILTKVSDENSIITEANQEGTLPLPLEFTGTGNFILLRIKDSSMIEAGILENDLALIRLQAKAENGDLIAVLLEDSAIIRRFFKEKNYFKLEPESKKLDPVLTKDIKIVGKVVGIIRKY